MDSLRFVIISDTHFGDDDCSLVSIQNDRVSTGQKYQELINAAGKENDYLILAGDIFDFSIASYEKAYRCAQRFFQNIKNDKIVKETGGIIYLPGNHDGDIWHIIQHERNVINRLQNGKLPKPFTHSVPGIIDDRTSSADNRLKLYQVREKPEGHRYGNMFLDKITQPETVFNIAYPNLYIVTDRESVLVTHGHYLEPYWALLGEIITKIAADDLKVDHKVRIDIEKMVQMNFPLNQLACTGIGQAGIFTQLVRQVQQDVKNRSFNRLRNYLDGLEREIDNLTHYDWFKEAIADHILKQVKEQAFNQIQQIEQTRYSKEFIDKKEVRERFFRFYYASLLEILKINTQTDVRIPAPGRVIFGHTHQPIGWKEAVPMDNNSPILHNTGGWLYHKGAFVGAEIFTYDSKSGFSSIRVR